AKNGELELVPEYAHFLREAGADAVIISDLGVLAAFREAEPRLERHISTQASVMNWRAAEVYHALGAKRIVLARELPLEEIRALRARLSPEVELEAFVHGAMCMAYSGRCLLSSYLTGRSGNRGECSQPCRWSYALTEEKRPGEFFPIEEYEGYSAILSSHDLCAIGLLEELQAAGVTSFKIEGRMKTAYYVATAVNAYRRAMDGADIAACRAELEALKHRPYSEGFYRGALVAGHYNSGRYSQTCTFVASVLGWRDGVARLRQRNRFALGETLEVLSPHVTGSFPVTSITTEGGEAREAAPHPNETLLVPCPYPLEAGDMLRRREK
ncbi:MAG: peptidase U32 family protein, partial [bacterium]